MASGTLCLEAVAAFKKNSKSEVERVSRNLHGLSADDQASLVRKPDEQVRVMKEAVDANHAFLDQLVEVVKASTVEVPSHIMKAAPSSKVVQTLLQTFVREWSQEGLQERNDCYERLLGALEKHLGSQRDSSASTTGAAAPRVMIPSTELGRLAFEVTRRGFQCGGCEARPLYFYGSELVRQRFTSKDACVIQPFALNTCNRLEAEHHVRRIPMPEVAVPSFPSIGFGDFTVIHDAAESRATQDAVLTSFSLDAAPNVLRFIRTVAHVVRPGGIWANFGPLAYDSEHDEGHGPGMELSWEELKYAISHFFEVQEESFVEAFHASNALSLMQLQYSCIYFCGIRNSTPAEGIGEK